MRKALSLGFLLVAVLAFFRVSDAQGCMSEEVITPMFAEQYQATLEAKFEGASAQAFVASLVKNGNGEASPQDALVVTVLVYTSPMRRTNKFFFMGSDGCMMGHGTVFKEDYAKILEGMKSVAAPSRFDCARPGRCL